MGRLTSDARTRAEQDIRAAMDRLLHGDIPPGGRCDIKTLAAAAGVTRTGFYPKDGRPGPYQHLAGEFHRRLAAISGTGSPDPRDAQITRLKDSNNSLSRRLAGKDTLIAELTSFRCQALSRLAAQHDEIQRLRDHIARTTGHPQPPALAILHTRKEDTRP
jgi:hypothetical protein